MSTEKMRKLMMLAEGLDDAMDRFPDDYAGDMEDLATTSSGDEYCPTCDGWGEYMPKGSSMGIDFDDIVPCPDCGPDDDYKPRLKSQVIKDLAHEMDMEWTDADLVDVDPADLKGFPKVEESEERPYLCVHAKKGKHECKATSSYGAAKKAAEHWGLKSTAGIDAHLTDIEHSTQFVGESFTRKHFQMVADTLQKIEDPEVRRAQAEEYAAQFAAANPRFRRDLFMAAAGVLEEAGPGDDEEWDAHWARMDGDDERADDLDWDAEWARMDADDDELEEVQTLPREIKDRKPIKPDWSDVEYETCADCGVEGGHENDCPTLAALYNEDLNEAQSEFRLAEIVGKDGLAELLADLRSGGIDYNGSYFTPLYWHFLDEYPDEIPVGSRTGRPEDPEDYVLDNLERYHKEEIESLNKATADFYGNREYVEENDDDVTSRNVSEEGTDGKRIDYPESWEEKFQRIAKDQHERELYNICADDEMNAAILGDLEEASCPCGKEGCECGPDCDCEPVEEGFTLDAIVESLLDERGQPKDYEMSDDELAAEIEDETSEFERDSIDPEIEDEELGLRFD